MREALTEAPPTPPFIDLPLRLELSRRKVGLHQEQLAAQMGLARRTIANYEGGHTEPKLPTLKMWAEICNVPLEWLVFGVDRDPQSGEVRSRCFSGNTQVSGPADVAPPIDVPDGYAADTNEVYRHLALGDDGAYALGT